MDTIRAYIGYNDWTDFEIVDRRPKIGGTLHGELITNVEPVSLDCEQGNDDVLYSYEHYRVTTVDEDNGESHYPVAVEIPTWVVENYLQMDGSNWFYNPDTMTDDEVTAWEKEQGHKVYPLGNDAYGEFLNDVANEILDSDVSVEDAIKKLYNIDVK